MSEIGEQWSPQTAPAIHAEIEMIISVGSVLLKTATTIGMRIPNVPQDVPVAKARKIAITNTRAGRKLMKLPAPLCTIPATNSFAPRLSVIPFNVHARVRIRMAGTIALNPSGRQAMMLSNFRTLRIRYAMIVTINAPMEPSMRPTEASDAEKASTNPFFSSPLAKNLFL